MLKSIKQSILSALNRWSYKALDDTSTRKRITSGVITVDDEITDSKRKKFINTTKELEQNFGLIEWALNTHITYTSSFRFQARCKNKQLNTMLENYMQERTKKENIDVANRLSLQEMMRVFERQKILTGDSFILKLSNGKLQILDSWQIGKANDATDGVNEQGLILDKYGAVKKYAICRKINGALKQVALISSDDVITSAYLQQANQTRGISPLASVINTARDIMDSTNYYLLKCKLGAIFGVVLYRDHSSRGGFDNDYVNPKQTDNEPLRYNLQPGLKLELEKDEKAEFLESHSPPQEYVNFTTFLAKQILSTLAIPYTLYDSSTASYSAVRGDLTKYKNLTESERQNILSVYDEITEFMLKNDIENGTLKLPEGQTYDSINWQWIHLSPFSIDFSSEIQAHVNAINAGLESRSDAIKAIGSGDFYQVADKLAEEQQYYRDKNITVQVASSGAKTTADIAETELPEQTK